MLSSFLALSALDILCSNTSPSKTYSPGAAWWWTLRPPCVFRNTSSASLRIVLDLGLQIVQELSCSLLVMGTRPHLLGHTLLMLFIVPLKLPDLPNCNVPCIVTQVPRQPRPSPSWLRTCASAWAWSPLWAPRRFCPAQPILSISSCFFLPLEAEWFYFVNKVNQHLSFNLIRSPNDNKQFLPAHPVNGKVKPVQSRPPCPKGKILFVPLLDLQPPLGDKGFN